MDFLSGEVFLKEVFLPIGVSFKRCYLLPDYFSKRSQTFLSLGELL